jgi:hypothetical protein
MWYVGATYENVIPTLTTKKVSQYSSKVSSKFT